MPSSPSMTSRINLPAWEPPPPPKRRWSHLRRPVIFVPLASLALFTYLLLPASSPTSPHFSIPLPERIHSSLDDLFTSSSAPPPAGEFHCNPFASNGRLHVDLAAPSSTLWKPFDASCAPSAYLSSLYRPDGDTKPLIPPHTSDPSSTSERVFLPWLMNRTVVIHGDSIDRFHLKDFCSLVQGRLFLVTPSHPASPPPYVQPHVIELDPDGKESAESVQKGETRRKKEAFWEGRPGDGQELTNPWVCDVEEYGATLVSVFTWGLEGAEHFFETERWYHGPASWVDRLNAITKPLLERLAKNLDRPQIIYPDLIEISSGFWDLRKYTEEDFVANGFRYRPYPEESAIPYTNLSPEREATWELEARKAIKAIARSFKSKDGSLRHGPTILWRTLHHPHRHNYTPFPRVFALDSLAREVISDLQASSSHRSLRLPQDAEAADDEDYGFDERLRVDEWGNLMSGQEHHFRDLLHPLAVPGSWVWADVMLYELKRAVLGIGRS